MLVKEKNRCQRLILCGRGHVFTDGEMGQEPVEVLLCEFARMSAVVKRKEAANPVEVGLFGAATIVPAAQSFNHAVVEPRCRLTK
jgi:hypothetical protein